MPTSDVEKIKAEYRASVDVFVTGDAQAQKDIWSRRDDTTLANPLGPPARGWRQVEAAMDAAASQIREGEPCRYELVSEYGTADMAYTLEIQSTRAKFGSMNEMRPVALRVTTIFRREEDGWRVAHRHADSITEQRSVESLVQDQRVG